MCAAKITRETAQTDISVEINLDGTGQFSNETGVGFGMKRRDISIELVTGDAQIVPDLKPGTFSGVGGGGNEPASEISLAHPS